MNRYTAAPSATVVAAVKSLHENIRDTLGGAYETFLQGSYKNDTSVPDLNDVDIVAIRKGTFSRVFTTRPSTNPITWEAIFDEVQREFNSSQHYRGKTTKEDKCIRVHTGFRADVVPAIEITDTTSDPIAIYSRGQRTERRNLPRVHYVNGVEKQRRTNDRYKATVRLFKHWARNRFQDDAIAPSFYLECLVHSFTDESFLADPAERFLSISSAVVELAYGDERVRSVAGDKLILVDSEWGRINFKVFQDQLGLAVSLVQRAASATSQSEAATLWRQAFNE